jgi:hypothetical protein
MNFGPTTGTDGPCLLMFSGGRDSTLAALRLHNSGTSISLVTVTSAPSLAFSSDYAKAARLYRKAIKQGNANAKANLARLYAQGLGVSTDLDEAERLFRGAAAAGVPTAQRIWPKKRTIKTPAPPTARLAIYSPQGTRHVRLNHQAP